MPSEHQIEAQLLGNRPRGTRRKPKRNPTLFNLFFLVPTVVVGGFAVNAWLAIAVSWFGQVVPGSVLERHILEGSSNRPPYRVKYSYIVDGHTFHEEASVHKNEYDRMPQGKAVMVRFFPYHPRWGVQLIYPYEDLISDTLGRLVWALFCTFWFGMVFWRMFIFPVRERSLVANGLPTVGRLTEIQLSKGESYMMKYEYAPIEYSNDLLANEHSEKLQKFPEKLRYYTMARKEEAKLVAVGDFATVLFDPRKPKRSLIYKFSDYEVVS